MPTIVFEKMHGIGNDFVLIDNRKQAIKITTQMVKFLGDRHKGVGFDQLIVLDDTEIDGCDSAYRFFNPDGSEAEQCGNGQRCIAKYLHGLNPQQQHFCVFGLAGLISSEIINHELVMVNMGQVTSLKETSINAETLSEVVFGNPHLVLSGSDISHCELEKLNKIYSKNYSNGINFELAEIIAEDVIKLRVYERGTGETLACGSGACAAVYALQQSGQLKTKVKVILPGGILVVEYEPHSHNLYLTGEATHVFSGEINT